MTAGTRRPPGPRKVEPRRRDRAAGSRPAPATLCAALALVTSLTLGTAFAQEAPAPAPPAAPAAADDGAELAKKLANPIASLISVPLKLSWDTGIGTEDADRLTFIVQPVVPFSIGEKWNLITRTIVPYVDAQSPVAGGSDESGVSDITQSFFFSPKALTKGGITWGVGPAILWPTASNDAVGSEKWGVGPTIVMLKQTRGKTVGLLANHIVSFAGEADRDDVNATFLQPFFSFTNKKRTTFGVNTETTYDWEHGEWTVPLNLQVSQLVKLGKQPLSFAFNPRYYLAVPAGGPDWGFSFTTTLLFPK